MERRKFLVGMGSLAAGGAATIGTGAFTQAQTTRQISVNVVTDENAYLELNPTSPYATTQAGKLMLDFSGNGRGQGVNKDSDYLFNDVFQIRNMGTEDNILIAARVTGQLDGPESAPGQDNSETNQVINLFPSSGGNALSYPNPEDNFQNLDNDYAPRQVDSSASLPYPQLGAGGLMSVGIDLTVDDINTQELTGEIDLIAVKSGT